MTRSDIILEDKEAIFLFYQFRDKLTQITADKIDEGFLTVGYVNTAELSDLYEKFGFRIAGILPDAIRLKDGTLLNEYRMVKKLRTSGK